jgi:hypothetical protein
MGYQLGMDRLGPPGADLPRTNRRKRPLGGLFEFGLNWRMPANVPKFGGAHAETGFDRECVSSNHLSPASQSGTQRNHP